jgi:hypothetical protein
MSNIILSNDITLTRDTAADSIAVVRLLRQNRPDMAMFIIASYADSSDALQALVGSMAAFANAMLTTIDGMTAELNKSCDTLVPGGDAVLASAAAAVVVFDPAKDGKASG